MRSLPGFRTWVRRIQCPARVGRTSDVAEQDLCNSCGARCEDQPMTIHDHDYDTPAMLEDAHGGDEQRLGRGVVSAGVGQEIEY